MKKIRIFAMLLSLACATGFVACDDDEDVKQALQTPSVSDTFSDYQSLDFKWDAVDNTIQYGYKLYSSDDMVVEAGVTKGTEIRFTGLQPASTYKLLVWAFAGLDSSPQNTGYSHKRRCGKQYRHMGCRRECRFIFLHHHYS